MKKTPKKKRIPTADDIAAEAMAGKDVSRHFTGKFKVVHPVPVQRVNVDFTEPMLKELDDLVAEMNISRQAVIKTFIRQCLDQHYMALSRLAASKSPAR
jgi:hypothetical protein